MHKIIPLFFVSLFISCDQQQNQQTEYSLVWSDEFDQNDNTVDSSKWFMENVAPNNGSWFNDELQHYTNRLDNA